MLSNEFRQSNGDWNPAEILAQHSSMNADKSYWADVERDLAENPDIWALPEHEDFA
ncbi:MAG: hypothetical protein AAFR51_08880 [Pseudomonadota bacterium]